MALDLKRKLYLGLQSKPAQLLSFYSMKKMYDNWMKPDLICVQRNCPAIRNQFSLYNFFLVQFSAISTSYSQLWFCFMQKINHGYTLSISNNWNKNFSNRYRSWNTNSRFKFHPSISFHLFQIQAQIGSDVCRLYTSEYLAEITLMFEST